MSEHAWLPLVCFFVAGTLFPPAETHAQFMGTTVDGTFYDNSVLDRTGGNALTIVLKAGEKRQNVPERAVLLSDPKHPIRWLMKEAAGARKRPDARIEFLGGDCLPCRVVEYRYGTESLVERQPPHLIVEPLAEISFPGLPQNKCLRVRIDAVRRIITRPRTGDRYIPATVHCADGRQIAFRSVRWTSKGVMVLTADGMREFAFSDIDELHLPQRDPWEIYGEMLALICPDAAERLVQIEDTEGVAVTDAVVRCQTVLNPASKADWYHRVQPAWSLDPFWMKHRDVRWYRWLSPHEVPLTMIEPSRSVQRSPLLGGWNWQADRNVLGRPLRNGGRAYGWGLGTLAYTELEFPLPATARTFRSLVGLDEAAGRGGCARGLVYRDRAEGTPLWQSPTMVGAKEAVNTGSLAPSAGAKPGSLVLVSHPAYPGEPAADPLNVRDFVNWLEPVVELDPEQLRAEVQKLLPAAVPAWNDWEVSVGAQGRLVFEHYWDRNPAHPSEDGWRTLTMARGGRLVLKRHVEITPQQQYLCVMAERIEDRTKRFGPSALEVRADGRPVARWDVPSRGVFRRVNPRLVSLHAYQGRTITIEVEHLPGDEQAPVAWQVLELVSSPDLIPWTRLEAVEARSSAGSEMKKEAEQIISVAAQNVPKMDTYTIVADTPLTEITGFRLELLTDPQSPGKGVTRVERGVFFLSEFRITAAPRQSPEQAERLAFTAAEASEWRADCPPAGLIDDAPETGWTAHPRNSPHTLVLTTRQPVGFAGGTRLTFTLGHAPEDYRSLGRFRLSVTQARPPLTVSREPVIVGPPEEKK